MKEVMPTVKKLLLSKIQFLSLKYSRLEIK